jgi:FixJ family two-component response regulator
LVVVDDDASRTRALDVLFGPVGLVAWSFGSAQEFFSEPPINGQPRLVVDVRLPGMSGLDLRCHLAECDTALPIITADLHARFD